MKPATFGGNTTTSIQKMCNLLGMGRFSPNAMKKYLYLVLCSFALAAPASASLLDLNVLGGVKQLSHTDWGSRDSQGTVGVEAAVSPPLFPFSIVGGYLHSEDSNDQTQELWVGPGIKIDLPIIHFLFSGGAVNVRAEQSSVSDHAWGYYLSGSAFFKVLGHLNLGAQIRHSAAEVTLGSRDIKAGGMSYLGLVGLSF